MPSSQATRAFADVLEILRSVEQACHLELLYRPSEAAAAAHGAEQPGDPRVVARDTEFLRQSRGGRRGGIANHLHVTGGGRGGGRQRHAADVVRARDVAQQERVPRTTPRPA